MATVIEFQKRLAKIADRKAIEKILFDSIRSTEKIALSLQKQQLGDGRDNEDKEIGVYSEATENWPRDYQPRKPKIAGQPYNFEDTGGFFDNMKLVFGDGEVSFWSTDSKTPLLADTYGNIFGLDDTNLRNYIQNSIYPLLMLQIRKTLLLE